MITRLRIMAMVAMLALVAPQRAAWAEENGVGVRGRVTHAATGQPVSGVSVQAGGQTRETDADGLYALGLGVGQYDLALSAEGFVGMTYRGATVADDWLVLDIELMPRDPSPEQAALLEARLAQKGQALDAGVTVERGFGLTGVQQVPASLRVLMPDGTVVVLAMDDYLKGVVGQEMYPGWPMEALKAQAVAARSYAATSHAHADERADVCTTVHCQVWSPIHYETTDLAVDETHGVVGTYQGDIIRAFFFAHCDGQTRTSESVWGGYLPYCRSVTCPCGWDAMWGHGVGMCQYGAKALAEQGAGYADILKYYYSGISVSPVSAGRVSGAMVLPLSGTTETEYVYEATYSSELVEPPAAAHVLVDGHALALDAVGGWSGGQARYRLATELEAGEHSFQFYFDDSYGHVSRVPVASAFPGPSVAAATSVPTPPPVPNPAPAVRYQRLLDSSLADWALGEHIGTVATALGDGALHVSEGYLAGRYVSPAMQASEAFQCVGVRLYGDFVGNVPICSLRTSSDGLVWGEWHSCSKALDDPQRHRRWHSALMPLAGRWVQYALVLEGVTDASTIESVEIVCLDGSGGSSAADLALDPEGPRGRPELASRAAWWLEQVSEPMSVETRTPRVILFHQVDLAGAGDLADYVRCLAAHQAEYLAWGDIGYNWLVDSDGTIYQGCAGGDTAVGRHAGVYDYGSLGIALVGDLGGAPEAMVDALVDLVAWLCVDHLIEPRQTVPLVDRRIPALSAHAAVQTDGCSSPELLAVVETVRERVVQRAGAMPPKGWLSQPSDGEQLSGVVEVAMTLSCAITETCLYLDDHLLWRGDGTERVFKWNSTATPDGPHRLRLEAANGTGALSDEVSIGVDNTAPSGTASGPLWSRERVVRLALSSDADQFQVCPGWVWEGEALAVDPGQGRVVPDVLASNGWAMAGRSGVDEPGGWYGPYTCDLPSWSDYAVHFRLRSPETGSQLGLATLDVADDRGSRVYAARTLSGRDLASADYHEIALALSYDSRWPTCESSGEPDGLEFRTWYSGMGDLYLDRVAVYEPLQVMVSALDVTLPPGQGRYPVLVRFVDQAGNGLVVDLEIGLDSEGPEWRLVESGVVSVQDATSGLEAGSIQYGLSADEGISWSDWERVGQEVVDGVTEQVRVTLPSVPGQVVRLTARDLAGNSSTSGVYSTDPTPTTEPTAPAAAHWLDLPLVMR